ncbi:MAG: NUDIX domain-containing protein [Geminicoccaceae bacterium]
MSFSARAKVFLASLIFRQKVLNRWAHKGLPTKRLAAGVLLFDGEGRLLVLKTTYRKGWLVPGGIVERNESPWEGARREVREEIGLELDPLRFAAMDWRSSDDEYDDSLHFIFDGGVLSSDQQAAIRPDGFEIADYRFADRDEAKELLDPHLCRRIMIYLDRDADETRPLVLNRGAPDRQTT